MPRVSAPLVLLPAWLVMVACSPHSLRIGKCCSHGTLGTAQPWGMPPPIIPGVPRGHLALHCALLSLARLAGVVTGGGREARSSDLVSVPSPLWRRRGMLSPRCRA